MHLSCGLKRVFLLTLIGLLFGTPCYAQTPINNTPINNFIYVGENSLTLSTAITGAPNGTTIVVRPGYAETIIKEVDIYQQNLTIKCEHGSSFTLGMTIDPPNYPQLPAMPDYAMIVVKSGASLTMDGCDLVSTNDSDPAGIKGTLLATESATLGLVLTNNTFEKCYYYCAYLIDLPSGYIHGNTFTRSRGDAITLFGSNQNVLIDSNHCDGTGIANTPAHKCIDAHSGYGIITGKLTAGQPTITNVSGTSSVLVGNTLVAPGIPAGAKVSSYCLTVDLSATPPCPSANTITLTANATMTPTDAVVVQITGQVSGTTSAGSTSVTGVSAGDLAQVLVGRTVSGSGIPSGTTVVGIVSGGFTLSNPAITSVSGDALTINHSRQIQNLTISNNSMIGGSVFCVEAGDFFGMAPTNVVVTGNSCQSADLARLSPLTSFTGHTTAGTNALTVTGVTGTITMGTNLSDFHAGGVAPGSVISGGSGTSWTLTQNALATETVPMATSSAFGGYSFQNINGLTMTGNSFYNTTGSGASPGAIELVGDTFLPYVLGAGPMTVAGNTLVGGSIAINTVSNVTLSGNLVQMLYPGSAGTYEGAVNMTESHNVSISGGVLDTSGVGPTIHASVYDFCNALVSCSTLSINGVTAIDDGQSTGAAYYFRYAIPPMGETPPPMANISITGGQIKGFTYSNPTSNIFATPYYVSNALCATLYCVTNVRISGVDDSANNVPVFKNDSIATSQLPGLSNQLVYSGSQGATVGQRYVQDSSGAVQFAAVRAIVELAKAGPSGFNTLGDTLVNSGSSPSPIPSSTSQPFMLVSQSAATSGSPSGWYGSEIYEIGNSTSPVNPYVQWVHRFGAATDYVSTRYVGGLYANNGGTCVNATLQSSDNPPCNYALIRYSTVASDSTYKCVIGSTTGQQIVDIKVAPSSASAVLMSVSLDDVDKAATCTISDSNGTLLGSASTTTAADYPLSAGAGFVDWNVTQSAAAVNVRLATVQGSSTQRVF